MKHDPGALNVFERPVPIIDDRRQPRAIIDGNNQGYSLSHIGRIARRDGLVNPLCGSVH
jgi:hypothetical protein